MATLGIEFQSFSDYSKVDPEGLRQVPSSFHLRPLQHKCDNYRNYLYHQIDVHYLTCFAIIILIAFYA